MPVPDVAEPVAELTRGARICPCSSGGTRRAARAGGGLHGGACISPQISKPAQPLGEQKNQCRAQKKKQTFEGFLISAAPGRTDSSQPARNTGETKTQRERPEYEEHDRQIIAPRGSQMDSPHPSLQLSTSARPPPHKPPHTPAPALEGRVRGRT